MTPLLAQLAPGQLPGDFFKPESLGSFLTVVTMTTVVCNTLQRAAGFNPRWLGLVVAEALCLANFGFAGGIPAVGWFVAVVNGCLVYLTAVGVTSVGGAAAGGAGAGRPGPGTPRREFWSPWY